MQLGYCSAVLPDLELDDVLAFAAECDLECVEVMCWPKGKAERRYAGVTHIDVDGFEASDAKRVRALCDETGVAISALGYYPNPLSPDTDEARVAVEHLEKVIAAAAALGLDRVNTFIGRDPSRSVDANWPRLQGRPARPEPVRLRRTPDGVRPPGRRGRPRQAANSVGRGEHAGHERPGGPAVRPGDLPHGLGPGEGLTGGPTPVRKPNVHARRLP